ncbi:DegV family protein [Planotetraspora phitsanulokensis]|uniref:DegV domain-containing protein n=2 Tax=Planotetraspora phitsanulokensis TaxID=575192 RepID=A0A8J3U692_9ACTN|nr:DegV domain-containing protein [Planotetraspora phitsanulokensis]
MIAVVTDSTAYLGEAEAARQGIAVVTLRVAYDGQIIEDRTPIDTSAVADALRGGATTSRPSPQLFTDVYGEAAAQGATGIVSVHLSGELSGTVDSALVSAREAPIPVEVIDSRSIAMGLGFPVLAAAQAARRGAALADVVSAARRCADVTRTFFYVDTLEHLRRSGRIGAAANLVGSALAIKPLMRLGDGPITVVEKVRTAGRAIARLEDLAVEVAADEPVNVAVQHLMASARAGALAESLSARLPGLVRMMVVEVGPALGAHVGPGLLGVTVSTATE